MKIIIQIVLCLLISACNPTAKPSLLETKPLKGELVFLLNYDKKLPSDVGFLTNHIVERRLANLLKEDFGLFMSQTKNETLIHVDTIAHVVYANFLKDSTGFNTLAYVLIDVKNDAFWIGYEKGKTIELMESPSIKKPEIKTLQ